MAMALKVNANGNLVKFYESGRLHPYRDAKRCPHFQEAFLVAYESWAKGWPDKREESWDVYCDIRDGFAIGTNKALRDKRNSSKMEIIEPRYIKVMDK